MKKRKLFCLLPLSVFILTGCTVPDFSGLVSDLLDPNSQRAPEEDPSDLKDEKTYIDLSRQEEIMRKCYDAGLADEILKHHECYSYTYSNPTNPSAKDQLFYIDADCIYKEWVNERYEIDFPDDRISVVGDFAQNKFEISLNINENKFKPREIYVTPFEHFFDMNDGDDITDIYTLNGKLYVESKYNQQRAEEYEQKYLLTEPLGNGYITTLLVANATTYEPILSSVTLHKDGKDILCYLEEVSYDQDPPGEAYLLITFLDRPSRSYTNVTAHVNYGTEKAFDVSVRVPSYTEVNYFHDGNLGEPGGWVYFDDAECTSLTKWDRISDFEKYFFTDPSEELLAKYTELYNALVLGN